jgi:hypothetical protein
MLISRNIERHVKGRNFNRALLHFAEALRLELQLA